MAWCEWETLHREKSPPECSSSLYALRRRDGSLLSRTLHDFRPGVFHPQVKCGRTRYQMRAVRRRSPSFVQAVTQRLCGKSPWTGLRLLRNVRAALRSAVRHLHQQMRLRADLSTSTRRDETSAGFAGGTRDLRQRHQQTTHAQTDTSSQWTSR